ncbi:hypothetical protein K2X05_07715 [bacterium]|nr:hypothetical protein [bacterium]
MKILFVRFSVFLLFILSTSNSFSKIIGSDKLATIKNTPDSMAIELSPYCLSILRKTDPGFQPFSKNNFPEAILSLFESNPEATPMSIFSDFNNDRIADLIVLGQSTDARNAVHVKVYGFFSKKNSHELLLIKNWSPEDYQIPGQTSLLNENRQIRDWSVFLALADQEEVKFHKLTKMSAVLKLESDNTVFGYFTFKNNKIQFLPGSPYRSQLSNSNKRIPSEAK